MMIKNIFHEADVERLKELVAESNLIVLTCHAGPDGDALGATLGMAHYLKALGKVTDCHLRKIQQSHRPFFK